MPSSVLRLENQDQTKVDASTDLGQIQIHGRGRRRACVRGRERPRRRRSRVPTEPCSRQARTRREMVALAHLAEHDDGTERPVRYGNVAVFAFSPGRAMIRHHINILSDAVDIPAIQQPDAFPEAA